MRMNRLTTSLLLVVALGLPLSAGEITVGSFVQRIAQSKRLESTDARIAVESLRRAGIQLPVDLELTAPLTEGNVASISRALGLAVSTNRPAAGFSTEQVDKFFASFRVELALSKEPGEVIGARGPGGAPHNPYAKGKGGSKGKKRGHDFTPTEPE